MKFGILIGLWFILISLIFCECDTRKIDRGLNKRRNQQDVKTLSHELTRRRHQGLMHCKGKGCRKASNINKVSSKQDLVLEENRRHDKQRKRQDRRQRRNRQRTKTPVAEKTGSEEIVDINEYIPAGKPIRQVSRQIKQKDKQQKLQQRNGNSKKTVKLRQKRKEDIKRRNRINTDNKQRGRARKRTNDRWNPLTESNLQYGGKAQHRRKHKSTKKIKTLKSEINSSKQDRANDEARPKTTLSVQDGKIAHKHRRKHKSTKNRTTLKNRSRNISLKSKSYRTKDGKHPKTKSRSQQGKKPHKQKNKKNHKPKSHKEQNTPVLKQKQKQKNKRRKLSKSTGKRTPIDQILSLSYQSDQDSKQRDNDELEAKSLSPNKNTRKQSKTKQRDDDEVKAKSKSLSRNKERRKQSKTKQRDDDELKAKSKSLSPNRKAIKQSKTKQRDDDEVKAKSKSLSRNKERRKQSKTKLQDDDELKAKSKFLSPNRKAIKQSKTKQAKKQSKSQAITNSKQRDQGDTHRTQLLQAEQLRQYNKELKTKKELMLLVKENQKLERQIARLKQQSRTATDRVHKSKIKNRILSRIKGHRRNIQERKTKVAKLKRKLNKTGGDSIQITDSDLNDNSKRIGTNKTPVTNENIKRIKNKKAKTKSKQRPPQKNTKGKRGKDRTDDQSPPITQEPAKIKSRKQYAKQKKSQPKTKHRNGKSGVKNRNQTKSKKSKSRNNMDENRRTENREDTKPQKGQSGAKAQKTHKTNKKTKQSKEKLTDLQRTEKSQSGKTISLSSKTKGIVLTDSEPLNTGEVVLSRGEQIDKKRKQNKGRGKINSAEEDKGSTRSKTSKRKRKGKNKSKTSDKELPETSDVKQEVNITQETDQEKVQPKKEKKDRKSKNKRLKTNKPDQDKNEAKNDLETGDDQRTVKRVSKGKRKGNTKIQTSVDDQKEKGKGKNAESKQSKSEKSLNEELKGSKRKKSKQLAIEDLPNIAKPQTANGRKSENGKTDTKQTNENNATQPEISEQIQEIDSDENLQIIESEGVKLPTKQDKQNPTQSPTRSRKRKRPGKKRSKVNSKTKDKTVSLETRSETVKLKDDKKKDSSNVSPALTIFDKISFLPTRKPTLNHDIAKDLPYRLRRPQTLLKSPAGVSRLEEELRPGITKPITNIKDSLQNVLKIFQRKVTKITNNYGGVTTDAKEDIMAVRKALQDIADENDRAFDSLLDVAGLVRYIYKRAHEHTGPTPSPERMYLYGQQLPSVDFRYSVMLADQSASRANYIYQNTMGWKSECKDQEERFTKLKTYYKNRQCMDQEERFAKLKEKNSAREPNEELRDLVRNSRRIHRRLRHKIRTDVAGRVQYYKNTLNGLGSDYFVAWNLSNTAHEEIRNCMKITEVENKKLRNRVMKARKSTVHFGNSSISEKLKLPPDDEDGMTMRDLTSLTIRVHRHARGLQRVVDYHIGKFLIPSYNKGKTFFHKTVSEGTGSQHQVLVIVGRTTRVVRKIDHKMDEIRIFLGNEDVLKQRCEALLRDGSGIEEGETIIDCEELGFVVEQSGSGSGDEEFIATAKPSVTVKQTVSPPPESTTEASIVDGSGSDDFVFAEKDVDKTEKEDETDNGGTWWWQDDPNALSPSLFKNVLRDRALDARKSTEELNSRAIKTETRRKALNAKWGIRKGTYIQTSYFVGNATKIQSTWREAKSFVSVIGRSIADVYQKVTDQENVIKNKTARALEIAEKHLRKKSESNGEDMAADEPMLMSQLSTAVNKIKANTRSILELQREVDSPCRVVETAAARLRNNIADLRKKIQQARTITSSIPVVVEMNGKATIKLPLETFNKRESVVTSFEMCVKPNGTDMSILDLHSNDSISYQLSLEDSFPKLSLVNPDQSVVGSMTSSYRLDPDTWHQIHVSRYGQTVQLRAKLSNTTEEETIEKSAFLDIRAIQKLPTIGYIGGRHSDGVGGYQGCIGDVAVDGFNLGLAQSSSGAIKQCQSRCKSDKNSSVVFEGNGYVKFPLDVIGPQHRVESIHIRFQTSNKEGTLFLLNNKLKKLQVLLSLSNGAIHMESRNRRGTIVLRSKASDYSSGAAHTIKISFRASKVEVTVDDIKGLFEERDSTQVLTPTIPGGVYLGGWGSKSKIISGKTKLRPLIGCVSFLKINNKMIPMFMQQESEEAYLGTCDDNIWMRCVRFTDDSKRFKLTGQNYNVRMYITVSKDSTGTILHYNRKKNIDIELSLESDGLTVSEELSGKDEVIKTVFKQQWMTITVLDVGKEVRVILNGTTVTFPYKKQGWLVGTVTDTIDYAVALGGKIDEEEGSFWGGISTFVVNDRPVNLRMNATEHNLNGCERHTAVSPGDFIDTSTIQKPVC